MNRPRERTLVVADLEHAAAINEANWHVNHNRNHARTEDGARQAEDFLDAIRGSPMMPATMPACAENDRAFYDTGIERSR